MSVPIPHENEPVVALSGQRRKLLTNLRLPHAAGAAYAIKLDDSRQGDCVICYFGDGEPLQWDLFRSNQLTDRSGAASEGDFHAALGMNSVLGGPCVWFCRNNGYVRLSGHAILLQPARPQITKRVLMQSNSFAISTPIIDQYAGDGIASRGPAYGLDTIRVDGNDALAVYAAVQEARARAVEDKKGVLVEAMTYRVGHHSTSDDSSKYRPAEEVKEWMTVGEYLAMIPLQLPLIHIYETAKLMISSDNPIHRFRNFLVHKGWWSEAEDVELIKKHRADVLAAFKRAEKLPKPKLGEMFTNVWVTKKGGKQPEVIVSDLGWHHASHLRYSRT